jgi:hypothetical protein
MTNALAFLYPGNFNFRVVMPEGIESRLLKEGDFKGLVLMRREVLALRG